MLACTFLGHRDFYKLDDDILYMVKNADYCICCISHTWGGAYKYATMAKRHGLTVINLGTSEL